jgi:Na+/H+ antiporter NhaD/arsenite permease-like protein
VIGAVGVLSALLANDIVCLAVAPLLLAGCARRGLDPVPFLLALACAANVGSAATLIGNPQNMLIGQTLHLSFAGYMLDAMVPSVLGLGVVWAVVTLAVKGRWRRPTAVAEIAAPPLDRYQTGKGLVILAVLVVSFLICPAPREVLALAAAGVLLTSRKMASRDLLDLVDWHLLVLFVGLFVVNFALADSGTLALAQSALHRLGVDLGRPEILFPITVLLSNLVSNVPAVILLLPQASHLKAGPILALASTLAGNLFIVGSIANIIVVEQAAKLGVRIGWREHARVGVPVTAITLLIAALWIALRTV